MTALHTWTERQWTEVGLLPMRQITDLRPGFFRVRLAPKAPWSPGRIYAYRPRVAGCDHLAAHVLGEPVEPGWLWLHGREITQEYYQQLMASPPAAPMEPVSRRKEQPNGH